jgi:hypothetical protein
MLAARRRAQLRLCVVGGRGVTGDAAQVHQVDHCRRGAALGDLVERRRHRPHALSHSAELDRHRQAQKAGFRQGLDRFLWKRALAVDARGMRRDRRVRHALHLVDDVLLLFTQPIHAWLRSSHRQQLELDRDG